MLVRKFVISQMNTENTKKVKVLFVNLLGLLKKISSINTAVTNILITSSIFANNISFLT